MHGERRRKRVFVVITITNIKDREVLKLHNFFSKTDSANWLKVAG